MRLSARPLRRLIGQALAVTAAHLILLPGMSPTALGAPASVLTPTSPAVWAAVGQDDEDFGLSVAAAGDVNRDGYDDVIVGAPSWGEAGTYRGRALVYLGSAVGLAPEPAWVMEGRRVDGGLGYSVAGAGDVNGDGFDDVVIGEYGFDGGHRPYRGRALIVPGSPTGPRTDKAWSVTGEAAFEYFGEYVAGAGDVNGDGLGDLLVGCSVRTALFLGRRGGLGSDAAWTGLGSSTISGAGDVNGDGFDDVLVGSRLFVGSAAGLSSDPVWSGPWARGVAGGGDVNGDGFDDVVLGAAGELSSQLVLVYPGSPAGLPLIPAWELRDTGFRSNDFGSSASVAGDVNADGYDDLVVAAPDHWQQNVGIPSAHVYLGGPDGPSTLPEWTAGEPWSHQYYISVALGADVNGDGSSEVLVGKPRGAGRAYLYSLGPGYPAPRIFHEHVEAIPLGSPAVLEAMVTDATRYVARAELLYREEGAGVENEPPVAMERVEGDLYRVTLSPEQVGNIGLVYSIRAVDDYGVVAQTIELGLSPVLPEGVAAPASRFAVRLEAGRAGSPGFLSFTTSRWGPARVRLFDVHGRLAATLLDDSGLSGGAHSVRVDAGRIGGGSGVYFFRVETVDGSRSGKVVLAR